MPVPTRPNYQFAGWYTDPTNGTRVREGDSVSVDTPLYAHWITNAAASIGPIYYETLQEALRDVPTDNTLTAVTLLRDTLEAVEVIYDQNIVLDLNGYRLYNNGNKNIQSIIGIAARPTTMENVGTIKIMNGTIDASSTQSTINNTGGVLELEDVTVTQTGNKSKQAIYNDGGTVTISGNSSISAKNSGAFGGADRGAIQNISTASSTGTVIILEGSVTSTTSHAIVNQANSILILGDEDGTIDDSTPVIQGKKYGIVNMANGEFNFYDGIVKGKTDSISGTVTNTETNATRVDSTEIIGSDTYYTTKYQ